MKNIHYYEESLHTSNEKFLYFNEQMYVNLTNHFIGSMKFVILLKKNILFSKTNIRVFKEKFHMINEICY